MATRTHTVFFDEMALSPLVKEYHKLRDDYERRKPYFATEALRHACEARLDVLRCALGLLGEPVSDALY